MTKAELILELIPGLVTSTGCTNWSVRQTLETYDTDGLNRELTRQRKLGWLKTPTEEIANDEALIKQINQIRAEARAEYENDPDRIRQRQQQQHADSEVYRDYALTQIFKCWVPGHGWAKRNKASEALIISWLNYDENL
jgi:hypothetical protein